MGKGWILITGGAGFIGSHLVDKFLASGYRVIALDDFSSGNINNVWHHMTNPDFRLVRGSVTDAQAVHEVVSKVEVVYHLAAQIHVDKSILEPDLTFRTNSLGTLTLLEAARRSDVKLFVYMSSCEVYGSAQYVPMDEKHPLCPSSPYAASKVAADRLVHSYFTTYKLPLVVFRGFNTFGPRQRDRGYAAVIPKFIKRCLTARPPVIYGDGKQTRDYMFITDMTRALQSVLDAGEAVHGLTINVGTGREVGVLEIAHKILKMTGVDLQPVFATERPGEVKRIIADTSLAKKVLGFSPKVNFDQGLSELMDWYKGGGYEASRAYVTEE